MPAMPSLKVKGFIKNPAFFLFEKELDPMAGKLNYYRRNKNVRHENSIGFNNGDLNNCIL